jgi:MFS family permease
MTTLTVAQVAGQTGWWAALAVSLPMALAVPGTGHLAAVTAAWGAPAVLSRLVGAPIDRLGPRRVGTACWLASAIAAALAAVSPRATLPMLVPVLAAISGGTGMAMTAGQAAPTWLPRRPDLARAGIWLLVAAAVPVLVGPLGGTSAITYAGYRPAWSAVALLFLLGAVGSALVPAVRPEPAVSDFSVAVARRALRKVVAVLLVTGGLRLTYGMLTLLAPLYVHAVLHAPLVMYGWVLTSFALGGLAAMLVVARHDRVLRSRWGVAGSATLVAGSQLVFSSTSLVPVALLGAAMWGACAGVFTVCCRAVIVAAVPSSRHGRSLGWWLTVQNAANVLPAVIATPIVVAFGLHAVLAGTCLCCLACGLAYLGWTAVSGRAGVGAPSPS